MAKNVETTANKKELGDLVSALGENRLPLRKPCMQGTRTAILQEIENDIKNVDGHSVIWIRGSPGVGKSALAASTAACRSMRHYSPRHLHLSMSLIFISSSIMTTILDIYLVTSVCLVTSSVLKVLIV